MNLKLRQINQHFEIFPPIYPTLFPSRPPFSTLFISPSSTHQTRFPRIQIFPNNNNQNSYFILLKINNTLSASIHMSKSPHKNSNPTHLKSKSPITEKRSRSHSITRDIHSCRKNKFPTELDLLLQQLNRNKNKLASCLQIYSILESNHQSQRCLQHNNTLTLYCLNERRILCVSCLYGLHKHRSHKVIPLKDCIEEVREDNKHLKLLMDEELHQLEYLKKISEENRNLLESQLRKSLVQLQKEYTTKISELNAKYEKNREQIKQNYVSVIDKCEQSRKQLEDFRYKIWETVTRFGNKKISQENDVMKQLLYVSLIELCDVKCRPISKGELEGLSRRNKL